MLRLLQRQSDTNLTRKHALPRRTISPVLVEADVQRFHWTAAGPCHRRAFQSDRNFKSAALVSWFRSPLHSPERPRLSPFNGLAAQPAPGRWNEFQIQDTSGRCDYLRTI